MNRSIVASVRRATCVVALMVVMLGAAANARSAPNPKSSAPPASPLPEQTRQIYGLDESMTTSSAEELRKALEAFQQQQFDESLRLLRTAADNDSELPPGRLLYARLIFAAAGKENKLLRVARANLEQVAVENPNCPEVYLLFGNLAIAEGRLTDAMLEYERAVSTAATANWSEQRLKNFQRSCYSGMTTVAEQRQDWNAANSAIYVWLKMDPDDARAHQRLARVLFFREPSQPEEAFKELQQAVQLDSSLEHSEISMGWLFTQKGELDEAEKWMLSAAKAASDDSDVRSAVSAWLLNFGRVEEAREHALAAIALNPSSDALKRLNATIAFHAKDYDEAERRFGELHEGSPDDFFASNYLALSLIESDDASKQRRALALAEINARQYSRSPIALSTVGWVYYRLGRLDEAERLLRAASSGGRISSETAYYLAHVLADRGRLNDVGKLLRLALDAPGRFAFRQEAEDWLSKLTGGKRRSTRDRRNGGSSSSGSNNTNKKNDNTNKKNDNTNKKNDNTNEKNDNNKKNESKPPSDEDDDK